MNTSGYDRWLLRAALFALAYVVIGLATAELGGATATHHVQMAWPVITGLASFGAALVAAVVLGRVRGRAKSAASP